MVPLLGAGHTHVVDVSNDYLAIIPFTLIGFAALSINVIYLRISETQTQGTTDASAHGALWNVGALQPGASATIRLVSRIPPGSAGHTLLYVARVERTEGAIDVDHSNDADSVSLAVSHN